MMNTMLDTSIIVLAANVNFDALPDEIKTAFAGEFFRGELTNENTLCRLEKERNDYCGETVYLVEISYFYEGEDSPDITGKYFKPYGETKTALDELITAGVQYALAHINDIFD